jgi:hypothetical protein
MQGTGGQELDHQVETRLDALNTTSEPLADHADGAGVESH